MELPALMGGRDQDGFAQPAPGAASGDDQQGGFMGGEFRQRPAREEARSVRQEEGIEPVGEPKGFGSDLRGTATRRELW